MTPKRSAASCRPVPFIRSVAQLKAIRFGYYFNLILQRCAAGNGTGLRKPVSKEEVMNERSTRGSIRRISQPYRISIAATAARCGGICVSG